MNRELENQCRHKLFNSFDGYSYPPCFKIGFDGYRVTLPCVCEKENEIELNNMRQEK